MYECTKYTPNTRSALCDVVGTAGFSFYRLALLSRDTDQKNDRNVRKTKRKQNYAFLKLFIFCPVNCTHVSSHNRLANFASRGCRVYNASYYSEKRKKEKKEGKNAVPKRFRLFLARCQYIIHNIYIFIYLLCVHKYEFFIYFYRIVKTTSEREKKKERIII